MQQRWETDRLYQADAIRISRSTTPWSCSRTPAATAPRPLVNFALADIHARYKRMRGFNVLFPPGLTPSACRQKGLRIKSGTAPYIWTMENIRRMERSGGRWAVPTTGRRSRHVSARVLPLETSGLFLHSTSTARLSLQKRGFYTLGASDVAEPRCEPCCRTGQLHCSSGSTRQTRGDFLRPVVGTAHRPPLALHAADVLHVQM